MLTTENKVLQANTRFKLTGYTSFRRLTKYKILVLDVIFTSMYNENLSLDVMVSYHDTDKAYHVRAREFDNGILQDGTFTQRCETVHDISDWLHSVYGITYPIKPYAIAM